MPMIARCCLLTLAALALLCACSQMTPSPVTPNSTSTGREALAKLVIKVPPQHRRRRGRSQKYVSPATASLTYAIDGATPVSVSISSANPDCTGSTYLQCTIPLSLAPGTRTLSFETFDAGHNLLSANTDVSTNVKAGAVNQISVTLGGVATSIAIFGPNAPQVTGDQGQGFALYGNTPVSFSFVPIDSDGNFIIGPGAPQVTLSPNPTDVTVSTPPPWSPTNRWMFHSTYSATNPTIALHTTITAVASPVPNSGGTTVTATAPLALYQPWLYVTHGDNSVTAYDEQGNLLSPAGTWSNLNSGSGIAFVPSNGFLYILDSGFSNVRAYDGAGNYQFSISTGIGNSGIAYDGTTQRLYVSLANNTMAAFTATGNSVSTGGSWAGMDTPFGVAMNPANNHVYVANYLAGVTVYDEDGNPQTLSGTPFAHTNHPSGIAYDAYKGWFYIANAGSPSSITVYDGNGVQQTPSGSFGGAADGFGNGITFDPHNRSLYVLNVGATTTLVRYDENGNEIAPISIPASPFPTSILEVP